MEITVKMTEVEFEVFMDWRKDKKLHQKEVETTNRRLKQLSKSLECAVAPPDGENEVFRIKSQGHMGDLWAMLVEE